MQSIAVPAVESFYFDSVGLTMSAMQVAQGDRDRAAGIEAWLLSRDPELLSSQVQSGCGSVSLYLDSKQVTLQSGLHFELPS